MCRDTEASHSKSKASKIALSLAGSSMRKAPFPSPSSGSWSKDTLNAFRNSTGRRSFSAPHSVTMRACRGWKTPQNNSTP